MIEGSRAALIGSGLEFLHGLQAVMDEGFTDEDHAVSAERSSGYLMTKLKTMSLDERVELIMQLQLIQQHCRLLVDAVLTFSVANGLSDPADEWKEK